MVMLHVQVSLALLALAAGLGLLIWALRHKGVGVALARFFGVIIVVLSILGVLCAGYTYAKLWHEGYLDHPFSMRQNNNAALHQHNNQ